MKTLLFLVLGLFIYGCESIDNSKSTSTPVEKKSESKYYRNVLLTGKWIIEEDKTDLNTVVALDQNQIDKLLNGQLIISNDSIKILYFNKDIFFYCSIDTVNIKKCSNNKKETIFSCLYLDESCCQDSDKISSKYNLLEFELGNNCDRDVFLCIFDFNDAYLYINLDNCVLKLKKSTS